MLLTNPPAVSNPFFQQLGPCSIYPLVVLSTMATVIASQATISGAFSVTQKAIALGFFAAHAYPVHIGKRKGTDLHSVGELAAVGRGRDCRGRFRLIVQPGFRIRHCRDSEHADDDNPDLLSDSVWLEISTIDAGGLHPFRNLVQRISRQRRPNWVEGDSVGLVVWPVLPCGVLTDDVERRTSA